MRRRGDEGHAAGEKLVWHLVAPNVHDFMWAADPDYKHLVRRIPNGR